MQLTGIAFIYIGEDLVQDVPGTKFNLGGFEAEPVTGHDLYGFTEKYQPATLDMNIAHGSTTPVEKWRRLRNATIIFESDAGPRYQVTKAFTTKTFEITTGEGKIGVQMAGRAAELTS